MKKILSVVFLVTCFFGTNAQTADDVIAKYIDAMGGLEKLKSIKSIYSEGVAVMQNGFEITTKTYRVQGKLFRQEIDFGRGSITSIITDKEGWFSNPRNEGVFEAVPAEVVAAQQVELDCAGALVDYASKGHTVELTGKETIEGNECYVIKLTAKSGRVTNYYIDNKNWYIIRTSTKGGAMMGTFGGGGGQGGGRRQGGEEVEMKIDYSDFKKTADGFVFPMAVSRPGMGGAAMKTIIEKMEVNKEVDPKLFKPE